MASQRKLLLGIAVGGDVALLGYFKYYDFFVTSTNNLFALVGIDLPLEARSILLPVGISFFTFMGISYIVDVYRGDFEPAGFGTFAAYLSFFPHLVAGPIVRPGARSSRIQGWTSKWKGMEPNSIHSSIPSAATSGSSVYSIPRASAASARCSAVSKANRRA